MFKKTRKNLEDNPVTAWRVSPRDWELHARYDERLRVVGVKGVLLEVEPLEGGAVDYRDKRPSADE